MTSSELRQQAEELERIEKETQEALEMEQLIQFYVGKCYGSSKFRQKSKATYHNVVHIQSIEKYDKHKFVTAAGSIVCHYSTVSVSKHLDWMSKKHSNISYTVGNYSTVLNRDGYNMNYHMNNLIGGKKEIPYSTFFELLSIGEVCNQTLEEAFNGKISLEIEKTMGDSGNQAKFNEACKIAGIELIDLENHLPLLNVIKYAQLPGYVEDRYLLKPLAKIALETQIKLNNKQINGEWCDYRRRQRYERDNEIITNYISKLKL